MEFPNLNRVVRIMEVTPNREIEDIVRESSSVDYWLAVMDLISYSDLETFANQNEIPIFDMLHQTDAILQERAPSLHNAAVALLTRYKLLGGEDDDYVSTETSSLAGSIGSFTVDGKEIRQKNISTDS